MALFETIFEQAPNFNLELKELSGLGVTPLKSWDLIRTNNITIDTD